MGRLPMTVRPITATDWVAREARVSPLKAQIVMGGGTEWYITPDERGRIRAAASLIRTGSIVRRFA